MTDTPDTFKPIVQTIAGYAIRVETDVGERFYTQLHKHPVSSELSISAAEYGHGSKCTYEAVPLVEQAEVERLRDLLARAPANEMRFMAQCKDLVAINEQLWALIDGVRVRDERVGPQSSDFETVALVPMDKVEDWVEQRDALLELTGRAKENPTS